MNDISDERLARLNISKPTKKSVTEQTLQQTFKLCKWLDQFERTRILFIAEQSIDGCTSLRKLEKQDLISHYILLQGKILKNHSVNSINTLLFGFVCLTLHMMTSFYKLYSICK